MGAKRHDIVEGPTCRSILAGTCDATAPHASLAQHLRRRQIRCFSYNLEALQAGGRGILAVQALLFVREALTSLLQFKKAFKKGAKTSSAGRRWLSTSSDTFSACHAFATAGFSPLQVATSSSAGASLVPPWLQAAQEVHRDWPQELPPHHTQGPPASLPRKAFQKHLRRWCLNGKDAFRRLGKVRMMR